MLGQNATRLLPPGTRAAIAASLILAWSGARAADPVGYATTIETTGIAPLDAALSGSSQLVALQKKAPSGPFALVARARQDAPRLKTALESFGYYGATVTILVDGIGLDDVGLPARLESLPQGNSVPVTVKIDKGRLFHLRRISVEGSLPEAARRRFTLKPGAPAIAATVLAARDSMLAGLQEDGYALAQADPPIATEIAGEQALDIAFKLRTGPRVDLGQIDFTGLKRVNERYARRRLLLRSGQLFQPSKIEAARQDLAAAGVFSGIRIRAREKLDSQGRIPLDIDVTERPRHAVSFDIAYSTDLGGSAGATWSHRNLFGNAEQLNISASVTGLGGSASNGVGYLGKIQFIKPDYYHRDQSLELDLGAIKQSLDSYDQTAATAGAILTRKLSQRWSASAGLTATQEQITQEGTTRDYTLLAVPLTARFDSTDLPTPLEDPLHGVRLTLGATPTASVSGSGANFVILQGSAASYVDVAALGWTKPGRTVLAGRFLVGSAQGAGEFDLPPDQRFYGGGSATVRGFRYQSIGPQFPDANPIGGAAIDAVTLELRQRVWRDIGAVVFIDAGQVNASSAPFQGALREGAGLGVRYYTPIGPVRVDIAVPINKLPGGDSFELYLGLGQAF